jgi:heme oxygenase
MKDMQAHLEKLHRDAAECAIIRDLATDPKKRELFAKLAEHMSVLASEVERAIAKDTDKAASVCAPPGHQKANSGTDEELR